MHRIELRNYHCIAVFMAVSLMLFSECEINDYDILDPASAGQWTYYTTADGLPSNTVRDIKLDSRGDMWFTFPGAGIAKYSNGSWTVLTASTTPILSNAVICLEEANDGRLFFGTSDGLSILSASNTWSSYLDPATTMYVNTIKVARNGWIWVGTQDQGFYVNSGSGFTKTLFTQYRKVNSIEEGAAGNIFIGTDNGIVRWNGSTYSYLSTVDGLPAKKISSMYFDRKERMWIGADSAKYAAWIDTKGIHQVNLLAGSDSLRIRDIFEDKRGDIWFATSRNGLIRYDGIIPRSLKTSDGLPEDRINCIGEDAEGNLWFGLYSKGLAKYTLPIENR
jgi:ligand-binding sensor domain-containing protein